MADEATLSTADITTAVQERIAPSADASAAASTPAPADPASAGATAQPEETDFTDAQLTGMIPAERVRRALANREKKVTDRLTQQYDQQYGWAKEIDRSDLDAFRREQAIAGSMSPAEYVANLWQRVQQDPQHGPQLRSMAARILGQRQQPAEDAMPAPDIPTSESQGQPVVYSAQQLQKLLEWQSRRTQADVLRELGPMRSEVEQSRAEREFRAASQQADAYAAHTLDGIAKWPGFKEHVGPIMEKYAALGRTMADGTWLPDPSDPRTEGEKLRDIYSEVVLPTLNQSARQQAVEDITRKASASTINPNAAGTGAPQTYKTFKEGLMQELSKRGVK